MLFRSGVNLVDDMDVIQIDKLTNAGEKYFFKMLMKADTNIAWGEDVILLDGRVAAKASVSGTTITMKTPVETVEVTPSENSTYSVTGDGVIIGASLTLANKSVDKKATIDGIDVKGGEMHLLSAYSDSVRKKHFYYTILPYGLQEKLCKIPKKLFIAIA